MSARAALRSAAAKKEPNPAASVSPRPPTDPLSSVGTAKKKCRGSPPAVIGGNVTSTLVVDRFQIPPTIAWTLRKGKIQTSIRRLRLFTLATEASCANWLTEVGGAPLRPTRR